MERIEQNDNILRLPLSILEYKRYNKMKRYINYNFNFSIIIATLEAIVAQEHNRTTVTDGCGFDTHSGERNIKYFHFLTLVTGQSAALCSATQRAIPQEFVQK